MQRDKRTLPFCLPGQFDMLAYLCVLSLRGLGLLLVAYTLKFVP